MMPLVSRSLFAGIFALLFVVACSSEETSTTQAPAATDTPAASTAPKASGLQPPYTIPDSSAKLDLEGGITLYFIEKGSGPNPKSGSNVVINYYGALVDGSIFDNSFDKPGVVDFPLNNLIRGWQIGLTAAPVGSKIKLVVPPEMGYGSAARPNIPANSTLIFDIDLVSTY